MLFTLLQRAGDGILDKGSVEHQWRCVLVEREPLNAELIRNRLEKWTAGEDAVTEIMHTGRNDYVYPLVDVMKKKLEVS